MQQQQQKERGKKLFRGTAGIMVAGEHVGGGLKYERERRRRQDAVKNYFF